MLYSGFITFPRSVFWSAYLNGRSDNLDVIPPKMNRNELIKMIRDANTNDGWAELVASVRSENSPDHFHAIFAHAVERQAIGSAVFDAAKLLYEANISCRLPCHSAIEALIPSWDISIEEVPWYLTNQFGKDEMFNCLDIILAESPAERASVTLRTIRYWVDLNPAVG